MAWPKDALLQRHPSAKDGLDFSQAALVAIKIGKVNDGEGRVQGQVGPLGACRLFLHFQGALVQLLGLLVPAFMRIMGRVNWWAPRWMQRAITPLGLYESPDTRREPPAPARRLGQAPGAAGRL